MNKKKLVIVESPSKSLKIQEYLGNDYIVKASIGHICDLATGGKHGLGIDIENNFKPKYVLMDDKVAILDELMKIGKNCSEIFLFTDPDREGNSIAWHLRERLKDLEVPMRRGIFNEIKKEAILKAIKEAGEINMNSVYAQTARRILDRIVGFKASPFLIQTMNQNLSAGRVQSVLTRLVIDRELEIEKFVPEDFWTIQVHLTNGQDFITKYPNKITDEQTAKDLKKKLSSGDYIISNVLAEEEKRNPNPPLITSSLQQLMSKSHGFGADRTMKAAQSLYEAGRVTYLRTDSIRASDEAITSLREYLKDKNYKVPSKAIQYKNKESAADAHECLRPVDLDVLSTDPSIKDPDQKKVYDAIWKYFVASQMSSAIYNTLKVTAHVKNDPSAEVKASGKALKEEGFLEILGINDPGSIDIPNLKIGDELKLFDNKSVKVEKKQTQPPPRFSEDKLIKELVNKNIGRPATYADLLSKITTRNYVEKKGNVYHATDLGKKVTFILEKSFTFLDYDYTAKLEKQLDQIEEGKLTHSEMLKTFYEHFKQELDQAYQKSGKELCEKCNSPMLVRKNKANGSQFLGCSGYPKCKNIKNL
jgi:DNA topoisomerase-1